MRSNSEITKAWDDENRPLGIALGYPDCCVDAFCIQPPEIMKRHPPTEKDKIRVKASYINGESSGFIPCFTHAQLVLMRHIHLKDLIKYRDSIFLPFPLQFK